MWWEKLCECRHWSAGQAVSHSNVLPHRVGSPVHSYWPCMTLWPISMLSRIFDAASSAVPASQAGGKMPANSSARPVTSMERWALITRRM